MLPLIIPIVVVLAAPAQAQTYTRPEVVRGLCQPDGCHEFAVMDAREIAADREGALLKTRLKTFHASPAGRKDLGEEDGYVYCSPTRPAILADQDGRTMAFFLAPFATAEGREAIRRNGNYHAVYFAICHGLEAGRAAVQNLSGVAQSLGYQVALARSTTIALNRAADIMATAERRRTAASRETTLLPLREVPSGPSRRDPLDRSGEPIEGPMVTSPVPEEVQDEGWLAGPRRFTNQAFDALDGIGSWVLGR
jgi:hypothetical protein